MVHHGSILITFQTHLLSSFVVFWPYLHIPVPYWIACQGYQSLTSSVQSVVWNLWYPQACLFHEYEDISFMKEHKRKILEFYTNKTIVRIFKFWYNKLVDIQHPGLKRGNEKVLTCWFVCKKCAVVSTDQWRLTSPTWTIWQDPVFRLISRFGILFQLNLVEPSVRAVLKIVHWIWPNEYKDDSYS